MFATFININSFFGYMKLFVQLCLILFPVIGSTQLRDTTLVIEPDTAFVVTDGIDTTPVENQQKEYISIKGKVYPILVANGDTMVLANIEDVSVTSPRTFDSNDDYRKYRKYKYYAAQVYPYAAEAIKIFRKMEYATKHMKKRKRKKYIKQLSEELKVEFEKPLTKLSKTQGKILVKMIEKELDRPMYNLIKDLQGKFKAFYWNQSSKLYGYRLKTGYIVGENPILDAVIQDLNISYEVDEEYEELVNQRK